MKGVYIHIPFCKSICSYCDFCKLYYDEKWIDKYLNALEKEIDERYLEDKISSIYIGGGTPSALDIKYLNKLFKILKKFNLNEKIEFTFECNLNDINEDLISFLSSNNVNRLSIGIESFNKKNLLFLKREASYKDAIKKIDLCHKYNISNINVDLMYALKDEKLRMVKKDLRLMTKLNITHISTYSLIIENNTMIKDLKPIDEELDYKMYTYICKYLKKKKFNHYEISNFAKDGYESKHNMLYWDNKEYYGFGLSASGYIEGIRYTNTRNINEYFKENYINEKEILSEKDIMDYEIMLGLRKTKGINIKDFYNKYHVNIQNKYNIKPLIDNKDLIYENDYLYINPEKLYIMNEILIKIV